MSSLAYFQKNEKFKKISFYFYIKNFILNKYTNDFYYFFKKKFVIYKLKVFVKEIKDKKIKKEINFIFNFFTKRPINQKSFKYKMLNLFNKIVMSSVKLGGLKYL